MYAKGMQCECKQNEIFFVVASEHEYTMMKIEHKEAPISAIYLYCIYDIGKFKPKAHSVNLKKRLVFVESLEHKKSLLYTSSKILAG